MVRYSSRGHRLLSKWGRSAAGQPERGPRVLMRRHARLAIGPRSVRVARQPSVGARRCREYAPAHDPGLRAERADGPNSRDRNVRVEPGADEPAVLEWPSRSPGKTRLAKPQALPFERRTSLWVTPGSYGLLPGAMITGHGQRSRAASGYLRDGGRSAPTTSGARSESRLGFPGAQSAGTPSALRRALDPARCRQAIAVWEAPDLTKAAVELRGPAACPQNPVAASACAAENGVVR